MKYYLMAEPEYMSDGMGGTTSKIKTITDICLDISVYTNKTTARCRMNEDTPIGSLIFIPYDTTTVITIE